MWHVLAWGGTGKQWRRQRERRGQRRRWRMMVLMQELQRHGPAGAKAARCREHNVMQQGGIVGWDMCW